MLKKKKHTREIERPIQEKAAEGERERAAQMTNERQLTEGMDSAPVGRPGGIDYCGGLLLLLLLQAGVSSLRRDRPSDESRGGDLSNTTAPVRKLPVGIDGVVRAGR